MDRWRGVIKHKLVKSRLGGRYMGNDYTSVMCYLFIKSFYFYIYICRYLDQTIYIQLLFEQVRWYSKQVSKGVYVWYIGFYKQTCLYNYIPVSSCFINKCLHSSIYELSFKWRQRCFVSVILVFWKESQVVLSMALNFPSPFLYPPNCHTHMCNTEDVWHPKFWVY